MSAPVAAPARSRPAQRARALARRLTLGRYTGVLAGLLVVCVYLALTEPIFLHWANWQNIIRTRVRRAHARDRDDVRRPHRRHRPLDRLGGGRRRG